MSYDLTVIQFDGLIYSETEKFVEHICDNYNIANDYYGNILVTITEVVRLIKDECKGFTAIELRSFVEDGLRIQFNLQNETTELWLNTIIDEENQDLDTELGRSVFLIKSLVDRIDIKEQVLDIGFAIAGIGQSVAADRNDRIKDYLKETLKFQRK